MQAARASAAALPPASLLVVRKEAYLSVLAPESMTMTGIPALGHLGDRIAQGLEDGRRYDDRGGLRAGGAFEDRDLTGGVVLRRAELLDLDAELLAGVLGALEDPLPVFRGGRFHDDRDRVLGAGCIQRRSAVAIASEAANMIFRCIVSSPCCAALRLPSAESL